MSQLSPSQRELVALGAALGSNCVPCVEYHVPEAIKAGLTPAQIAEAVALADKVRQVPARKVLEAATRLLGETSAAPDAAGVRPGSPAAAPSGVSDPPCCGS